MTDELPQFDSTGIPSGIEGERFWRELVVGLFLRMEPEGWDQPGSLWAVLSPAATEAAIMEQAGRSAAEILQGGDPNAITTAYRIERLRADYTHPREWLPNIRVPKGAVAAVLITEAWTSASAYAETTNARNIHRPPRGGLRPSQAPDRVEIRQATILDLAGHTWLATHKRGTRVEDLEIARYDEEGMRLSGTIPMLLARTLDLPTDPEVSVPDIFGRVALRGFLQFTTHHPEWGADAASSDSLTEALTEVTLLHMLAGMLDALEIAPSKAEHGIIVPRGPRTSKLAHQTPGEVQSVVRDLEAIAHMDWDTFFAYPGSHRWIREGNQGERLTPALWAWYGPGNLARFLDERAPDWGELRDELAVQTTPEIADLAVGFLGQLGYRPDEA